MNWNPLIEPQELAGLQSASQSKPVIIIKHSTRCGISSVILDRLSRSWDSEMENAETYVVDVIANRGISNAIAEKYGVRHESPQLLVIWQEEVIFHTSHMGINIAAVKSAVQPLLSS